MFNFRTDMAIERNDIYKKQNNIENQIDGIETEEEEKDQIKISRVKILNEQGEKALAKPKGDYVTLDVKNIKTVDEEGIEKIAEILGDELREIIKNIYQIQKIY